MDSIGKCSFDNPTKNLFPEGQANLAVFLKTEKDKIIFRNVFSAKYSIGQADSNSNKPAETFLPDGRLSLTFGK